MRNNKGIQALAIGVVLAVQVAACSSATPGARRDATWSERLTRQAHAIQQAAEQQERSNAAWAQRYTELATAYKAEQARAQRADAAASQRLTKLAEYIRNGGTTH